jgi:hypothetical protein
MMPLLKAKLTHLLIAVFVIFILNFDKASSCGVKLTAESSSSPNPNIVQIINVSEEIKPTLITTPEQVTKRSVGLISELKQSSIPRARCKSFFREPMGFITRRQQGREYGAKIREFPLAFFYSCIASTNIIDVKLNFRCLADTGNTTIGGTYIQRNRMHPELWGMRSNKFLFGKFDFIASEFDGVFSRFPQLLSGIPQESSEYSNSYRSNCSDNDANNLDNTFHDTPPLKVFLALSIFLIPLLFLFATMGISAIAAPCFMQEENKESKLRYFLGWVLLVIAFCIGLLGYFISGLLLFPNRLKLLINIF